MQKLKKIVNKFKHWMAYEPPGALSAKDWRLFNEEFKQQAPIRWYIDHQLRRDYIWPIKHKIERIMQWIRYRTIDRYHIIRTGLLPGYNEFDTVMLHTNFTMLVDFVEVEQAYRCRNWEDKSFLEKHMPFYYVFKPFRRPDLGIAHNEWAATLDDPSLPLHERAVHQAETARETLALYIWWTKTRPSRYVKTDPMYSDQGLGIFGALDDDFDESAEDYVAYRKHMDDAEKVDAVWEDEDTAMLTRLIKIRRSLWT